MKPVVWLSKHGLSPCAGQLTRDFKHTRLDFAIIEEDGVKKLKVDCHLGKRKSLAVMRTVTSHIQNLFTGVSKVRLCRPHMLSSVVKFPHCCHPLPGHRADCAGTIAWCWDTAVSPAKCHDRLHMYSTP